MYKIRMGIPQMQELWESLEKKYKEQTETKNDITIIGIEPHPNDKKDAYQKITLSSKPEAQVEKETGEQNKTDKKKRK